MIKKAIIGTLALVLVAGFVLGRDAKSYIRTMGKNVRDAVKSEIDLDFEVERARGMVEDLVPEIEDCMEVVIRQQVDLGNMERKIAQREDALNEQKEQILALRTDLKSGKEKFVYARVSYTRHDVERDLELRLDRFKAAEATLNRDKKIMMAQREKLRANQRTLEGMMSEKKDLEVSIAQLEARLEQLQAEETVSSLEIDSSQLSRARQLIEELNTQIDVRESVLDAKGNFSGLIPVEQKQEQRDIGSEVDAYFHNTSEESKPALEVHDPAA